MSDLSSRPSSKVKNKAALALLLVVGYGQMAHAQSVEDLNIAQRSAFQSPAAARDPFLPIGWQKVGAVVFSGSGARTTEACITPEAFVVSSISLDRLPLAVINGKAYGEGDLIPFDAGGKQIQVQVFAVRDGQVVLRYKDFKVSCPIRVWQKPTPHAK